MALLGVNIDHVATLRQARGVDYPDPVMAAKLAQDCGADQITCHLREDRRHIIDADLPRLKHVLHIPLNLEMAATEEMVRIAREQNPEKVTLVPERRQELTTEGGLDVRTHKDTLKPVIQSLKDSGIFLSLFIDPDEETIAASRELGADAVEFHTGTYCNAIGAARDAEWKRLAQACARAKSEGFFVAVGHGLNYQNILPVTQISEIQEYNIGHSIVAHAVLVGWERAVREMKSLVT